MSQCSACHTFKEEGRSPELGCVSFMTNNTYIANTNIPSCLSPFSYLGLILRA